MKIRTKKKMNLPELIKHVWENEVFPSVWRREESPSDKWAIQFFEDGMFRSYNGIHDYDTFAVTVEEELTEDTEFDELWEVYYHKPDGEMDTYKNDGAKRGYSTSISQIVQENSIDGDNITLAIYYGSTLIWSKDTGIPESGVLEVEQNDQTT